MSRFIEVWRDVTKEGKYTKDFGKRRMELWCKDGEQYHCLVLSIGSRDLVLKGKKSGTLTLRQRWKAWRRGNRDMNGELLHEGDLIQLIDEHWLGHPLWGTIIEKDGELWLKCNNGFGFPLMIQESRIKKVKDKKKFFAEVRRIANKQLGGNKK